LHVTLHARESDHSPDVEVVVAEGKQEGLELGVVVAGDQRLELSERGAVPRVKVRGFREHADNARGLSFAE
jgi:hypothetical protein